MCTSRTVCDMYCSAHPAGSYSTLQNWIQQHSSNKIYVRNVDDVITYFDNNQVLARNWRVRYDAKAILSYITTVVHFLPKPITNLQINQAFSPRHWLYNINICDFSSAVFNFINHSEVLFRSLRDNFIQNRLQIIFQQQRPGLSSSDDVISIMLKNDKKTKFSENSRSKIDMYSFLEHRNNDIPEIKMGNPISVNPCSSAAVKSVLESLKAELDIPHSRQWSIVGCDGLPYLLSHKVVHDNPDLQDLLIQPGLGHFEINMSKGDILDPCIFLHFITSIVHVQFILFYTI